MHVIHLIFNHARLQDYFSWRRGFRGIILSAGGGGGVEDLRCLFLSFFVSLLCEFNRFVNLYFLRVCVCVGGGTPLHSYPIPFRSIEVNDFIVAILKA